LRVCDRDRKTVNAIFKNQVTGEEHDLCRSCHEQFLAWLGTGKLIDKKVVEKNLHRREAKKKKKFGFF